MKTGTHVVKYLYNVKVYFARPIVDILNVIDKHEITTVLFGCEKSLGLNRGRNRGIIDCPHHYVPPFPPLIELSEKILKKISMFINLCIKFCCKVLYVIDRDCIRNLIKCLYIIFLF